MKFFQVYVLAASLAGQAGKEAGEQGGCRGAGGRGRGGGYAKMCGAPRPGILEILDPEIGQFWVIILITFWVLILITFWVLNLDPI